MSMQEILSSEQQDKLLHTLKLRFKEHMLRHEHLEWESVQQKLEKEPSKLWTLNEMEASGGEPDVVTYDAKTEQYTFCDCSAESPIGRRSLCFDEAALESRKSNKPRGSALGEAARMGIALLSQEEYAILQTLGEFDLKTSSWIRTPAEVRELGGAFFGDRRYGRVFTYHNGAESYYGARGFRGLLKV